MDLTDILRCPATANRLHFDNANRIVRVENCDLTYPIIDGIVDFCPGPPDRISASYDAVAPRYDTYITSASLPLKICNTIVWGISNDNEYANNVFSYLPAHFDGILVDVPVGTGVFTAPVYARLPNATIIAVDSSMGMLRKAADRFRQHGLKNVRLLRADVANLPIADAAADIVLSMNGLHVFPDKQRAIAQIHRVTRPGGKLVACAYVKGVKRLADWFVKRFGVRNGYFNPPFFTLDDVASQFKGFTVTHRGNTKSIVYLEAFQSAELAPSLPNESVQSTIPFVP